MALLFTNEAAGRSGRILMVAPQPFYEDRGTPIAVRKVIEALSEKEYAIDLLTFPQGEDVEIRGLRTARVANPMGIRHVPIGLSARKLFFDSLLVPSVALALKRGRYDLVHAVEEAAFPAMWLCKRFGVPLLYDMQSCLPDQLEAFALFRAGPVMRALRTCEHWLIRSANYIVCSAGLGAYVAGVHPGANVREWHYPGMPCTVPPADVAGLRYSLNIADGRPVILYCGNFESYQGMDRLMEATPAILRKKPDAVFLLVGARSRAEIDRIVGRAPRLGEDSLRILMRQRRSDIPLYLAMADVLVAPRRVGGNLPLKIFDYMAARRPIVAMDSPCHRAVLTDETASLVPLHPGNGAPFAAAVVDILEHPARGEMLAANASRYAEENLGWLAFVERTARIYRSILYPGEVDG